MKPISEAKAKSMSVLTLAFVGDAVFSLFVRERLSVSGDYKSGALTAKAAKIVSATCQSKMLDEITPLLNENESDIIRYGRNAHTNTKAKNASLADYKKSTALETLFGYLHLIGQEQRLLELEEICLGVGLQ